MKITQFLKEKIPVMISAAVFLAAVRLLGYAFKAQGEYMMALVILLLVLMTVNLVMEFMKKRSFYNDFLGKLEQLDRKYLITEMTGQPEFLEGEILCESLYEIDKSMKERINDIEDTQREFREYVEMWIHEIKVPIATLSCMNFNGTMDLQKQKQQIDKLDYYVEQILFLSRADNPQKDYLLKKVSLEQVVNQVVRNHKELLLGNKIRIEKDIRKSQVMTDAKWLEFMLGQIVNNSVKYLVCKENHKKENVHISFYTKEDADIIQLMIEDNGIGVSERDLPRVFEKTFTGENGRKVTGSTGMGLYICKKLCDKLGHCIRMESVEGEYTRVILEFGKDEFYDLTQNTRNLSHEMK